MTPELPLDALLRCFLQGLPFRTTRDEWIDSSGNGGSSPSAGAFFRSFVFSGLRIGGSLRVFGCCRVRGGLTSQTRRQVISFCAWLEELLNQRCYVPATMLTLILDYQMAEEEGYLRCHGRNSRSELSSESRFLMCKSSWSVFES